MSNIEVLSINVSLIYFSKCDSTTIFFQIMKHILFNDDYSFFSLTCNEDEISLFVDENYVTKITQNIACNVDNNYKVIRVYDDTDGVDNIGVVSKLSNILSNENIPILYVNSYNNNYILFKEKYIDSVLKILNDSNFII